MPIERLARHLATDAMSALPRHRMAGPILARAAGRTELGTLPVEGTDSGVDHSHLDIVRDGERTLLVAGMGASPEPFAELVLPLTRGAIQLADARGFAGIAIEVRGGSGRYSLLLDSYGVHSRARFRTGVEAGATLRELRLPFAAFRSPEPQAELDLSALRALVLRLHGEPGGTAWLELGRVGFYRDP